MIRIQRAQDVEASFFTGRSQTGPIETVTAVLSHIRTDGDAALHKYSIEFESAAPASFEIPYSELEAAAKRIQKEKPDVYAAMLYSHELALRFAEKQKEAYTSFEYELEPGLVAGQRTIPVDTAGVYIPAGRFPLVSTVIMTVTPAVAAGVKNIVLCTPPRIHPDDKAAASAVGQGIPGNPFIGGKPYADEGIMAAACICGVTRAFACGGAQAVAAMAYGTESVPQVDVIVGPGNKFVAEAKRLVYGTVGIDMIAGPTEVFIIADKSADPSWVAADMLAQAEHDVIAQAVLATPDEKFANSVAQELEKQLAVLPTRATAERSLHDCGRIILTDSLAQAAELANRKAPEHLELALADGKERDTLEKLVRNYGSLFIGHFSAEVFGDYAAGINHTLPTSGSARFTGGLSVRSFLKTVTSLRASAGSEGAVKSAEAASVLGKAEGLFGHARAAAIRISK
ncbi:MAG: histidinol dehydrogenase [Treponema sp.]|jgi:histidinol dehydrogenase|nr:histidinol dehydrogenase [Treponema sp.]